MCKSVCSPVTPERLVSWKGLDQVRAQLQLLVEELQDGVGAERLLLVTRHQLCCRQLPVSLSEAVMLGAVMLGAAVAAAGSCAGPVLGGTGGGGGGDGEGGGRSLGELRDQLLEQELAVVEAAVVRDVHGHPEAHGGQLIMEHLPGNMNNNTETQQSGDVAEHNKHTFTPPERILVSTVVLTIYSCGYKQHGSVLKNPPLRKQDGWERSSQHVREPFNKQHHK